jgi:UDP-N-acetylglucosamine 2-epimerase (non-hydrolysing)
MTIQKKISFILGTRPEGIKLAPIITKLKNDPAFKISVCITGQHREMLDQVMKVFGINAEVDLNLMKSNQTLSELTSNILTNVDRYLRSYSPDLILVQGDTSTVMAASLAAYYNKIKIGHIEAGLRTGNLYSPWPEEGNRIIAGHLADLHFCPTETSRDNLIREGINSSKIFVTGNTVIDALLLATKKIKSQTPTINGLPSFLVSDQNKEDIVLITGHRRESFGSGFENICEAIARLAIQFPSTHFVYPVHLNPNVREPVNRILGQQNSENIHLIEPLDYLPFVALMTKAKLILTDSGGVQEEAPSLGKPVLVMRNTTERPEAVKVGTVKLVGTLWPDIVYNTTQLLTDKEMYIKMTKAHNPYGDGKAADRIKSIICETLGNPSNHILLNNK